MNAVHIFTAPSQPGTRDRIEGPPGKRGFIIRHSPRSLLWCYSCRKRRWAANVTVQVYYDCTLATCRQGKGCRK